MQHWRLERVQRPGRGLIKIGRRPTIQDFSRLMPPRLRSCAPGRHLPTSARTSSPLFYLSERTYRHAGSASDRGTFRDPPHAPRYCSPRARTFCLAFPDSRDRISLTRFSALQYGRCLPGSPLHFTGKVAGLPHHIGLLRLSPTSPFLMARFGAGDYKEKLGCSCRIFLAFFPSFIYEIMVRRKTPGREGFRRFHPLR